jgi:carbon-monoxide dehydrogenase iron sulfur subunit
LFKLKTNNCTNCRMCELACVWAHQGSNGTATARVRIKDNWPGKPAIKVCLSCKKRECVASCPEEALSWEGHVVLDADKCTGCQTCVDVCPVGGVHWDQETDNPLICDTCDGKYSCVKNCPAGAIIMGGRS